MEDRDKTLERKAMRALRMLLVQRGGKPGLKGWELRRRLGPGYLKVLELVKTEAAKLGLELRVVEDERGPDYSRYLLVSSESVSELGVSPLTTLEAAALAVILAMSYGGLDTLPLREVEATLSTKMPRWRVGQVISKLARLGYIEVSEETVRVGWRSKAEVDVNKLAKALFTVGLFGERASSKRE